MSSKLDHIVVVGCGTGRSGTTSLALLLGRCRNFHCTHEMEPLLPWDFDENAYKRRLKYFKQSGMNIGDVHSVYISYLERLIKDIPSVKVICTERDVQEVVDSFEKKVGGKRNVNHWYAHGGRMGWNIDNKWDPMFPKYDIEDRKAAIRKYVLEYHQTMHSLRDKYPKNILIVPIENLSTRRGQWGIFRFVGIKPYDRKYIDKKKSVHNKAK